MDIPTGNIFSGMVSGAISEVINGAISADELDRRFSHHPPPDEDRVKAHEGVRAVLSEVASYLVANTPAGREQSLAITKLEEAMYWANAALARQ
jgi:hypothetical protein